MKSFLDYYDKVDKLQAQCRHVKRHKVNYVNGGWAIKCRRCNKVIDADLTTRRLI